MGSLAMISDAILLTLAVVVAMPLIAATAFWRNVRFGVAFVFLVWVVYAIWVCGVDGSGSTIRYGF